MDLHYIPGMYFHNEDEANDWLDFEAGSMELEFAAYAENDRFGEWQQWREAWRRRWFREDLAACAETNS